MENYFTIEGHMSPKSGAKNAGGAMKAAGHRKVVVNDSLVIQDRGSKHFQSIDWTKPVLYDDQTSKQNYENNL